MPPEGEGQPSGGPRTSPASVALALMSMALALASMLSFMGHATTLKLLGVDVKLVDPRVGVASSVALLALAVLSKRVAGRVKAARQGGTKEDGGGGLRVEETLTEVKELVVEVRELCRGLQRSLEELKAGVKELAEGVKAAPRVGGERSRGDLEVKVGGREVDVDTPSLDASLILETLNALYREVKELRSKASRTRTLSIAC